MEQHELERFERILRAMLDGVEPPLARREQMSIEKSPDDIDQLQNVREREMAIRQLENDSGRLRNIIDALHRIKEGTYGVCLRCEEEIQVKRLNAVPWTPYCLECQTIADENRTQEPQPAVFRFAAGSSDDGESHTE